MKSDELRAISARAKANQVVPSHARRVSHEAWRHKGLLAANVSATRSPAMAIPSKIVENEGAVGSGSGKMAEISWTSRANSS